MKQTIEIGELAPSLNKWQKLHWAERAKIKKKWAWLIKAENPKSHAGAVIVTYTRVSTRKMDMDNLGASFKSIGDGLVKCGVIEDDNPDVIKELRLRWEKCNTLKEQKSIIELEDV